MAYKLPINWRETIKEQEASGKSVGSFCKEKGIRKNTFYFNRKKIRESGFIEIKKSACEKTAEPVIVKWRGYTVILGKGFCKETLNEVLNILEERQCL